MRPDPNLEIFSCVDKVIQFPNYQICKAAPVVLRMLSDFFEATFYLKLI